MLVDKVNILVSGGHGGRGHVSFGFKRDAGPDGGTGGKGGDVYMTATSDLTLLRDYVSKSKFFAEDGEPGFRNKKTGKGGGDIEILVPVGTFVTNIENGEVVAEFTSIGQRELIAKGGLGGRGNFEFKNSRRTTPDFAQPGLPGQKFELELNLKIIADYGFIGLPNAGKSSLLNELTNAKAKVGNFSFTTLSPNIGILKGTNKVLADIPGLIEGASSGKGLGIGFLKHIEKVKVLIHCISSESDDIKRDYNVIRNELKEYSSELATKKEIIVITKSDTTEEVKKYKNSISVSIHDADSIEKLKNILIENK